MRAFVTAAVLALLPGLAAPLAAQRCGILLEGSSATVTGAGGYARYDIGSDGVLGGGDLAVAAGPVGLQAGYRAGPFDPDPVHLVNAVMAAPILRAESMALCGTLHGGLAMASVGDDSTNSLAGGAGLRLALGNGGVASYVEVRGLAARTSGDVWGVDVDLAGYSIGGEAGIQAALGSFTLRLVGALDGLDGGLGVTPYPGATAQVGLGMAF